MSSSPSGNRQKNLAVLPLADCLFKKLHSTFCCFKKPLSSTGVVLRSACEIGVAGFDHTFAFFKIASRTAGSTFLAEALGVVNNAARIVKHVNVFMAESRSKVRSRLIRFIFDLKSLTCRKGALFCEISYNVDGGLGPWVRFAPLICC